MPPRGQGYDVQVFPPTADTMEKIQKNFERLFKDLGRFAGGVTAHGLLSGFHDDTVTGDPVLGDLVAAQLDAASLAKWQRLAIGTAGQFLRVTSSVPTWATIQETDIADGSIFPRIAANETITGTWTFNALRLGSGTYLSSNLGQRIISHDGAADVRIGDPLNNNNSTITFYTGLTQRVQIGNSNTTWADTQVALFGTGQASGPAISHRTDTNTGFYFANNDTVLLSCGGTLRVTFSTTQVLSTVVWAGPTGSAGTPALQHSGDTNTGIYFDAADGVLVSCGGTLRVTFNTTQVLSTVVWAGPNGSAATPALQPSSDTNTGIYFDGADAVLISTGGTLRAAISSGGLLQFAGTTSSFPALKRNAAVLETKLADDSAYAQHKALEFSASSANFLMRTSVAWNNGAGANVGTLNNAPTAGDPSKWIPVDDNGTTRYVPSWT